MELNDKNVSEKSKKSSISNILYVAASVVAILGVALLVNNILLFKNAINQYVAQGVPAAVVRNQLIPSQLLPAIFQSIAVYGGIAFVLLGIGIVNKKVAKCLILLNKVEICNDIVEESILEENTVNVENTKTPEHTEIAE